VRVVPRADVCQCRLFGAAIAPFAGVCRLDVSGIAGPVRDERVRFEMNARGRRDSRRGCRLRARVRAASAGAAAGGAVRWSRSRCAEQDHSAPVAHPDVVVREDDRHRALDATTGFRPLAGAMARAHGFMPSCGPTLARHGGEACEEGGSHDRDPPTAPARGDAGSAGRRGLPAHFRRPRIRTATSTASAPAFASSRSSRSRSCWPRSAVASVGARRGMPQGPAASFSSPRC
jgi:hypothetical protein